MIFLFFFKSGRYHFRTHFRTQKRSTWKKKRAGDCESAFFLAIPLRDLISSMYCGRTVGFKSCVCTVHIQVCTSGNKKLQDLKANPPNS